MEEEEEDVDEDEEEEADRLRMLEGVCQEYCAQLNLFGQTVRTAQLIIRNLLRLYPSSQAVSDIHEHSAACLVALGIYTTSRLADDPRSPKEICMVQEVNGDRVQDRYGLSGHLNRRSYSTIHDRRDEHIDDRVRVSLEVLVWPTYDLSETSDDRIEYGRDLHWMRKRCGFNYARLQVPSPIGDLSQHIAASLIHAGFHAFSYPNNSRHVSKDGISAAIIYTASHLVSRLISRRAIQGIMGEGRYPDIRSTCRVVRNACNQLVSEGFQGTLDVELSWDTLEAGVSEEIDDENDDLTEGDRSRGQGETTRDEVTSGVSASQSRTEQLVGLCKCRAVYRTEVIRVIYTTLNASIAISTSPDLDHRILTQSQD